jgi:hypothetical protein
MDHLMNSWEQTIDDLTEEIKRLTLQAVLTGVGALLCFAGAAFLPGGSESSDLRIWLLFKFTDNAKSAGVRAFDCWRSCFDYHDYQLDYCHWQGLLFVLTPFLRLLTSVFFYAAPFHY